MQYVSTKEDCHAVAVRIHELVEAWNIQLEMGWRRRSTEEIVLCDKISKSFYLSEYRIQEDSFRKLSEEFGPFSMDSFATDRSREILQQVLDPRFRIDGYFLSRLGGRGWLFPPTHRRLGQSPGEGGEVWGQGGGIVVPDWPGSEVDCLMQQASRVVELEAVREVGFESPTGGRITPSGLAKLWYEDL